MDDWGEDLNFSRYSIPELTLLDFLRDAAILHTVISIEPTLELFQAKYPTPFKGNVDWALLEDLDEAIEYYFKRVLPDVGLSIGSHALSVPQPYKLLRVGKGNSFRDRQWKGMEKERKAKIAKRKAVFSFWASLITAILGAAAALIGAFKLF